MVERTCTADGCDKPFLAKGCCRKHYYQLRAADPTRPRCAQDGCESASDTRGLCKKHYQRLPEWRERQARHSAKWRSLNVGHQAATQRAARLANPDEARERGRDYMRAWRAANPELNKASVQRWRDTHPEHFTLIKRREAARRRALMANVVVSKDDYMAVLAEHGMHCHICDQPIPTMRDLHFDHVIPLSKGGPQHGQPSSFACPVQHPQGCQPWVQRCLTAHPSTEPERPRMTEPVPPMVVDTITDVPVPAPDPTAFVVPSMLVDTPIELPDITPDPEPDSGRPTSDAHKDEWVAWAIGRGLPSYEAWALTVDKLKKLEL